MKYSIHLGLTLLLCLAALTGCHGGGHSFRRRLAVADTLMRTDADSAFRMLCSLDGMAARQDEDLRMRHLLLRCNAQNKAGSPFTSDSLGLLLTQYFDAKGTPNQRMLAHYMLACAYRDMKDWPEAQRCYNEAISAADTASGDCDFRQLSIICGQLAEIFVDRSLPGEAMEAYDWAEHYATKANDSLRIFNIWANKSNSYIHQDRIKEALELKEKAADGYQRFGHRRAAAQTRGLCIRWLAEAGELEKAKAYIDDYEKFSGNFLNDGNIKSGLEAYYDIKAHFFVRNWQLDSAEYYYRKLMRTAKTTDDRHSAVSGLSALYEYYGNADSLAKYAGLSNKLGEELYLELANGNFQELQSTYNYKRHELVAMEKSKEAENAWTITRIASVTTAILAILCIITYMKYRSDTAVHRTKEKDNALKIRERDAKLNAYQEKDRQQSRITMERKLSDEPIVVHFMEMARQPKESPSRQDWNDLKNCVEKFYPAMRELVSVHNFNWDEYNICLLVKLRFELRDIRVLTDSINGNLSIKRSRMYTKITGEHGSTENFDKYILSIELGTETLPKP